MSRDERFQSENLREETFHTAGRELTVARVGDGSVPLVLLHGVVRRWEDYFPMFAPLAMRWRCAALDFRGHGHSGRMPGAYLVGDYVQDAVAVLGEYLDQPALVYGHSLGALVAAAAAAQLPELVLGVVLEDPPFEVLGREIASTPFHRLFREMLQVAEKGGSVGFDLATIARQLAEVEVGSPPEAPLRLGDVRDAGALRFMAYCLRDMDPQVLKPLVEGRWMEGYDTAQILADIRCPVLLLQADVACGGMLNDEQAARAIGQIADCTHVKLEGVGHLIHGEQCETALKLTCNFFHAL
jgi:pimeloyl-ACP methyl ester carboxylesterase